MADYSQFFKKPEDQESIADKFGMSDQDKTSLANNMQNGSGNTVRDKWNEIRGNQEKAWDIAGKSERTPEEQEFFDKNMDPATRGMLEGGVTGTIGKVAGAAAKAAPGAFGRIQQMMGKVAEPASHEISQIAQAPAAAASKEIGSFIQTGARGLDPLSPAMVNNKNVINQMADKLGFNHPDVARLLEMYNKNIR